MLYSKIDRVLVFLCTPHKGSWLRASQQQSPVDGRSELEQYEDLDEDLDEDLGEDSSIHKSHVVRYLESAARSPQLPTSVLLSCFTRTVVRCCFSFCCFVPGEHTAQVVTPERVTERFGGWGEALAQRSLKGAGGGLEGCRAPFPPLTLPRASNYSHGFRTPLQLP